MNLALCVICDDAHERADGKFDVVGIFNELTAPGFPAVQARMTVVMVMEWTEDESGPQEFRAELVDGQGRRILSIEGQADVAAGPAARQRTRLMMPLEQVVFPEAGRYTFEVVAAGDVHRGCSLLLTEQAGR